VSTANALRSTPPYDLADPSHQDAIGSNLSALLLVTTDVVGIGVALWAFLGANSIGRYTAPGDWLLLWELVPLFLILYWFFDLYPGISVSPVDEVRRVCLANTVGFILVCVILAFRQGVVRSQVLCLPACICAFVLVLAMRAGVRRIGSRFGWWGHPVVLFGCGDAARSLLRKLKQQPYLGLRPVAVVTDHVLDEEIEGIPVYKLEYLSRIASAGVRHAIVAAPELSQAEFTELMGLSCDAFPHLFLIPDTAPVWKAGSYTQDLAGILGIQLGNNLLSNQSRIAKRTMDLVVSIILTLFLLPFIASISFLVSFDSGFPVFYSQKRLGRGGRTFHIWKFRTMVNNSAQILDEYLASNPEVRREWSKSHKLRNDPRITRVGNFLRRTSLDELPQLWNVINGDMSLVGPRPIVNAEVEKYAKHFSMYVKTTPGMTGLWQVSGRNHTTYQERVALDAYYVRNWSVWMDIYLLAKTVAVVLTRHGAF
jgi:Undecaprenyl-phosphate galactose phosphotransferase WbaP